jgi:Family of unknown function (DUF6338)
LLSLLGHFAGAAVAGLAAGAAIRVIARVASATAYGNAWDHFIKSCVRHHWVTIGLQTGDVYAGYIDVADTSVAAGERDVVLREPAIYDADLKNYRFLEHQSLFLFGSTISSVAVLYEPNLDKRITKVGDSLFEKEAVDGIVEFQQGRRGTGQNGEGIIKASSPDEQAVGESSQSNTTADSQIQIARPPN